jgi:LPPG:FO 2-phospho-L-lactate transferase
LIDTTTHGRLAFQDWLVRERAVPPVIRVVFEGALDPAPGLLEAIAGAELVVIGPSNPYVSIDPIFALRGVRDAVFEKPVVAVSPLVGGKAVKGPLGSMVREVDQREPNTQWILDHYRNLRGLVVERGDDDDLDPRATLATSTVMRNRDDSVRLAREVLSFAEACL